jgi:hypothetical protein
MSASKRVLGAVWVVGRYWLLGLISMYDMTFPEFCFFLTHTLRVKSTYTGVTTEDLASRHYIPAVFAWSRVGCPASLPERISDTVHVAIHDRSARDTQDTSDRTRSGES